MNHQPELYWISGSPYAWRVMLTLEVKQASYASHLLEASKGDLKKPEYLRLNPRGRVPTLKHGEHVLNESLAIMAYLDARFRRRRSSASRRTRRAQLAPDL